MVSHSPDSSLRKIAYVEMKACTRDMSSDYFPLNAAAAEDTTERWGISVGPPYLVTLPAYPTDTGMDVGSNSSNFSLSFLAAVESMLSPTNISCNAFHFEGTNWSS